MKSNSAMCLAAKARTFLPGSKAPVLVRMEEDWTYMVKATPTENDRNKLRVAKEIVRTVSHRQFCIVVANTSKVPVRFSKNMKMTMLGDALSKIAPVQEKIPVDPVNAMPIYKGKLNKERQFYQHQQVTKANKGNRKND